MSTSTSNGVVQDEEEDLLAAPTQCEFEDSGIPGVCNRCGCAEEDLAHGPIRAPVAPQPAAAIPKAPGVVRARKLGLEISPTVTLPISFVTDVAAILAKRGAGKTNLAGVLGEEMHDLHAPFVVMDPLGVWWGMRFNADRTLNGMRIIVLGGEHGDRPLEEWQGGSVAEAFHKSRVPMVLDLSGFEIHGQQRFCADFCNKLYDLNSEPCHIIVDEADRFAPQRGYAGDEDAEACLKSLTQVLLRGRVKGLGMTVVTQRSARLNKDLLTQIELLFALRTTGPRDKDAIMAVMKDGLSREEAKQVMASLSSLPVGTALTWAPNILGDLQKVAIRKRRTFDSSKTPDVVLPDSDEGLHREHGLDALDKVMVEAVKRNKKRLKDELGALEDELDEDFDEARQPRKASKGAPKAKPARGELLSVVGPRSTGIGVCAEHPHGVSRSMRGVKPGPARLAVITYMEACRDAGRVVDAGKARRLWKKNNGQGTSFSDVWAQALGRTGAWTVV